MQKASVIIINYNTSKLTLQCLASFYRWYSDKDFQVIVVDNASNIKDFEHLSASINSTYPQITLLRSRMNLGFGGGNMFGIQKATTAHYIFVNSDVLFIEDCLFPMLAYLHTHADVSMVGCGSIDENKKPYKPFDDRLGFCSELFGNSLMHKLAPKKYPNRKKKYEHPIQVGAVPGSLFVCKSSDFDAVGGFDTNLFLYYEEKELALRIEKKLKKKIVSLPNLHYIHLKGKSTVPSIQIQKELKISQFYALKKHLPWVLYQLFYFILLLKTLIKATSSQKNRAIAGLLLGGISVAKSMKHQQSITHD